MSVVGSGGGVDESTDVIPDEDEDGEEDRGLSSFPGSFRTSTFGVAATEAVTTAGTVAAAFLGFRPLFPPPLAAATAFRFRFPAGPAEGAIAAGLGAMGLNLSPMWPPAGPYLGARQHPPFLSIVQHSNQQNPETNRW